MQSVPAGSHLSFGGLVGFVASSFSSRQVHGGLARLMLFSRILAARREGTRLNTASSSKFRNRSPGVQFTLSCSMCMAGLKVSRFSAPRLWMLMLNTPDRPSRCAFPPAASHACSPRFASARHRCRRGCTWIRGWRCARQTCPVSGCWCTVTWHRSFWRILIDGVAKHGNTVIDRHNRFVFNG